MVKRFKIGGIHPAENKLSASAAIESLPIPQTVTIPLSQHIGAPSKPKVKKGDSVKVGQVVAEMGGFVSANIHSSVSGTVVKLDKVLDSSGYKRDAILIKTDGDEWLETIDRSDTLVKDITLSAKEIQERLMQHGIVGLGGATFPTHVKLSPPPGMEAKILIINGVECEPYLTSDHRLMLEKGHEMMVGITILMKALNVSEAAVGIENNKPDAIEYLTKLSKEYSGVSIVPLKVQYPQGGEKQLIAAIMNKEVPSGALPIAVGAVVNNVGTAFAAYEAVQKNKPLIERVVTVTGKSVEKPSNFMTRIGTNITSLVEAAGGVPEDTEKIINGGPMMGKALVTTDTPVTKGTSGILLMQSKEAARSRQNPCIRCGKCVSVCPMGLEPFLLMTLAEKREWQREREELVMDCIECGSCSYTCPSSRDLLDYIRVGKRCVGEMIRSGK